jgi:hypothetical protein
VIKWAEWVPVAAIVGAAATYIFSYIFREIESWLARGRELKGLLRLLATEIAYNQKILKLFEERTNTLHDLAEGAGLRTGAWEENRGRIAQLIKDSKDLQALADYFVNVDVVEKERLASESQQTEVDQAYKKVLLLLHLHEIQAQGEEAQRVINKEVGEKVTPQVEGSALEESRDDN